MVSAVSSAGVESASGSLQRDIRDYALAHLGKNFFWVAGDTLTIFILIRYSGYHPTTAGWLFLIALLWNATCDIVIGRWADRHAAEGRSLVPILAAALPVLGIAFIASLFLSNRYWGWTLLSALVFRTVFSLFDVPHNAMMARLSLTPETALRIANLRTLTSSAASLIVGLVAVPLLDRQGEVTAIFLLSALSLASVVMMIPFLSSMTHLELLSDRVAVAAEGHHSSAPAMSFVRLCGVTALGAIALAALCKAIMHLDLGRDGWATGTVLALMIGRAAATALAGPSIKRFGSAGALRVAYFTASLLALSLPFAVAMGSVVPIAIILMIGLAIGVEIIVSWLILTDWARSSLARMQRGSSYYGTFTMIAKVATGLGGFFLGLLLSNPTGTAGTAQAIAVMDAATLWSLCILATVGTGLAGLGVGSSPKPASA